MILSPQAQIAILAIVFAAGSYAGYKLTSNAYDAKQLRAERQWAKELQTAQQRANDFATKYEETRANVQDKYRTITKEVEVVVDRPVYRSCKLDADGLRLWNEANEGPGSGVADPAVPEAPEAP